MSPPEAVSSCLTISPLPRWNRGGMFLWHYLSGCPVWALPSTLPGGARTFLPDDLRRQSGRPVSLTNRQSTTFPSSRKAVLVTSLAAVIEKILELV